MLPSAAVTPSPAGAQATHGQAQLAVDVPEDAEVYVNGSKTRTQGSHRTYVSPGLIPGRSYAYSIRAVVERDGHTQEVTKLITFTAGDDVAVEMEFQEDRPIETLLTLHVPADAKVELAGSATKKVGVLRTFATSRLTSGEAWDGYLVRVTLERGGETLAQERLITVRGGQAQELTFDFDASVKALVASK